MRSRCRGGALLLLALAAVTVIVSGCGGSSSHSVLSYAAPSYSDWPYFGRDHDATRYAPETQINAANVHKLGVAWSSNLGAGQYLVEDYPVEVGGRLYLTTSSDEVQAYDATTGRLEWQYAPQVDFSQSTGIGGYGVTTNRGVAISDGKVFELTFDDHLDAVSQATGEQLWTATVAADSTGAYESMAPTVYDGLVFVGVSGSQDGIRGFLAAYNEQTGKQVWRFYTVPAAGTGWAPKNGGGGGIYMPPTVDTQTGIVYASSSTPAPTIFGEGRKGADLYTDSILAFKASTGKLLWYYQEVPHDLWDYGAASPPMIFDTKVNGKPVRAVAEAGKSGYVYIVNAATGKPLFSPVAYVKEGHPPPTTKGTFVCPGSVGGSPYSPLAFDPKSGAAYVAGVNLCQILKVTPIPGTEEKEYGGVRITPKTEIPTGTFDAVNLTTGKMLWTRAMSTPMIGGGTATASNLVFTGDQHGNLYAMNASTGKTIWSANLGLAFGSAPIIYTINGAEYVAAAIGGSATTASSRLGPTGAKIVVLKLGGNPISAAG